MKEKNKLFDVAYISACIYITTPFYIFLLGWTKWYIAIAGMFIVVLCFYKLVKDRPHIWNPEISRANICKIIIILLVIAGWVYMSGIGKLVFQNDDHWWRNTIFKILVETNWPTTYFNGQNSVGLIYYIAFWLPAAGVGKIFGLYAGFIFQVIWAFLGVTIFYFLLCSKLNKLSIWPLLIFIFFSGLDIVGALLPGSTVPSPGLTLHIEWWSQYYQFSSFTTQLFWVFNQCIPVWIITLLILLQKKNKYIMYILSFSMLSSTLPFIGLIPISFAKAFINDNPIKETKKFFKDSFSFENIIGAGFVAIISFLYLRGNNAGGKLNFVQFTSRHDLLIYLVFIFLECGVYFALTFMYKKKEPLYWVIFVVLLMCPLIRIGNASDFCMRASIPSLLILYIFVVQALIESCIKRKYIMISLIMFVVLLGSVTSIHEFGRTVKNTLRGNFGTDISEQEIFASENFTGDIDGNPFYQYIAK